MKIDKHANPSANCSLLLCYKFKFPIYNINNPRVQNRESVQYESMSSAQNSLFIYYGNVKSPWRP